MPTTSADGRDLLDAALVAPLAVPVVVTVWMVIEALARGHYGSGYLVLAALGTVVIAAFMSAAFALPVGYVMTLCVGLPVIFAWQRLRGPLGGPAIVALGAGLAALPILVSAWLTGLPLDETRAMTALAVFAACGSATAAAFWFIGVRDQRHGRDDAT